MNRSLIWFVPAFCVFLGILLLSTALSIPFQVKGINYLDKWEHAFAYFVLTTTILFGFYKSSMLTTKVWVIILLGSAFYGVILEWVQYTFFPNRYFEWLDATANVVGTLLGGLIFRLLFNGKR